MGDDSLFGPVIRIVSVIGVISFSTIPAGLQVDKPILCRL